MRFLDPSTGDETVDRLRSAARDIVEAGSYRELGQAGEDLAAAAQQVGADRWPRYLNDAGRRAIAAASDGAIPGVVKASATGTDTAVAGGILLGGFILYLA